MNVSGLYGKLAFYIEITSKACLIVLTKLTHNTYEFFPLVARRQTDHSGILHDLTHIVWIVFNSCFMPAFFRIVILHPLLDFSLVK